MFVEEQGVPAVLEWDALDAGAVHCLASTEGRAPVGTGRLVRTPEGWRIGRMAVLREWRGRGIGRAVLDLLVAATRASGARAVILHAQQHAFGFYARAGFCAEGPTFDEAGIAHRVMRLVLRG